MNILKKKNVKKRQKIHKRNVTLTFKSYVVMMTTKLVPYQIYMKQQN